MKIDIMKIHSKKPHVNRGSALTVTLITCTILGGILVACLSLIGTQQKLVCRSHNWNQAIVVAEGGVEEALALLNSGVQAPSFAVFPWTSSGGGVFKNRRPGIHRTFARTSTACSNGRASSG